MSKRRSSVAYVGSFPPPFGGVTVKNNLLYRYLSNRTNIRKIDLSRAKRFDLSECASLFRQLISTRGVLVIGVSRSWCRRLVNVLYLFNRRKLGRSIVFVMGGVIPQAHPFVKKLNCAKRVYVETETMMAQLTTAGASNVAVYPNCRERRRVNRNSAKTEGRFSAVFFSYISKLKGADVVLEVAQKMPGIDFHFYGRIDESYKSEFSTACDNLHNVEYHGIYDSASADAIDELCKYDVHLFPTAYSTEGVPGVIVETKIAGVPTIATDICYNSDLIEDGVDGFLIRSHCSDDLVNCLLVLERTPELLNSMKKNARLSSEDYFIDNYIDEIVGEISLSHLV